MGFDYHVKLLQNIVNQTRKAVIGLIALSSVLIWIYFDFMTTTQLLFWSSLQAVFIFYAIQKCTIFKKIFS